MFVDTSVVVAILANEPDAGVFAAKLANQEQSWTSALVVLEASMRLSTLLNIDPRVVEERIQAMLSEANIALFPIDGVVATRAVAAFAEYGKGRGHPARLNLADCMSYACAQILRAPLLFKGNDFSHTDIEAA